MEKACGSTSEDHEEIQWQFAMTHDGSIRVDDMKAGRGVPIMTTPHRFKWLLKIVQPHAIYLLTILTASCVVFTWFRGLILYQWDATFPFNPSASIGAYLWPWSDVISTGVPALVSKDLPYFAIVLLLHNGFGLSLLASEMSLYYLLLSMGGVTMYVFFLQQSIIKTSREARFGAFAASVVYMFNPYWMVYVWQIFSEEAFLYATLPLMLLFFQRVFSAGGAGRKDWGGHLGLASVSVLAAPAIGIPAFSIPLVLGMGAFYAIWVIHGSSSGKRLRSSMSVVTASIVVLGVSLWWVVPQALLYESQLIRAGGSSSGLPSLQDLLANTQNSNFLNVIRLAGLPPFYRTLNYPNYNFSWAYQPSFLPVTLLSLSLAITAFLALILRLPSLKRSTLLFAASSIIAVIPFVTGIQPPFGPVFQWVVTHFPSLATLFRDPYQKFGLWMPFGYSFLVGATFLAVLHKRSSYSRSEQRQTTVAFVPGWKRLLPLLLIMVLIGPVYAWPMLNGDVIPPQTAEVPSGRIQVPDYYFQAASWLQSKGNDYRTLSLPEDQILQSSNWAHGYGGQDILRFLTGNPIISTDPQLPNLSDFQHGLYHYIMTGGSNLTKVLTLLDIRFVLLRMDAGFYPALTQYSNLTSLRSYLQAQPGLQLARQFGPLIFYDNANAGPRVFVTSRLFTLSQLNRIGWDLAAYKGGWLTSSANITKEGSELVESTTSPGFYSYGFATTAQNLNISAVAFPYLKVSFRSTSNAALLLRLNLNNRNNVWLIASDRGNATAYGDDHYSSVTLTTLTYDLSSIPGTVRTIDLFVTNAPQTSSVGNAATFIRSMTFESFIGTPRDYVRAVAQLPLDPLSYAVVGKNDSASSSLDVPSPNLAYAQVSSIEYRVDISDARSQFVLLLTSTFDPSWQLSGSSGSVLDATHFVADGFANGWLIRSTGNFTFWISYAPRGAFMFAYLGSLISGLSLTTITTVRRLRRRQVIRHRDERRHRANF
jgi:hypothetical protein